MFGYMEPTFESFIQTALKVLLEVKMLLFAFISFPKHGFAYPSTSLNLKLFTSLNWCHLWTLLHKFGPC